MSPRETITGFFQMAGNVTALYPSPEAAADALMNRLKTEGLFVGPIVATPEMNQAASDAFGQNATAGQMWGTAVEEWQRREGA